MKIKNLTFPICARRTHSLDNNLIGYESLQHLSLMSSFEKNEQYLLFYNFMNEKKIQGAGRDRRPYYVRTNLRSPQTTFVIDFDNLVPSVAEKIEENFKKLKEFLGGKALIVVSASGNRHVIYVIKGKAPESFYMRMQKLIIESFFKEVSCFIDRSSSFSVNRGFYHSQHLAHWVKNGLINAAPSVQKKRGFFWNNDLVLNFAELMKALDTLEPENKRKIHELVEDGYRVLDYQQHVTRGNENEEKARNAERLCRILAELQPREKERSENYTEKIISRAKTEQYQAAFECLQRFVSENVLRFKTISGLFGEMAEGSGPERSPGHPETDGTDTVPAGLCELSRGGSESGGHGDSRSSGNDRNSGIRHRDDSSDESVLGTLSNLRSTLEARGIRAKELGNVLYQSTLRSYGNGDSSTEEPDIGIFASLLRSSLDRVAGVPRDSETSDERIYIWLRHARGSIRNERDSLNGLREFASDAARCFRLYLKTQNVEITLRGDEFQQKNSVSKEASLRLIEMIEPRLQEFCIGLSKPNRQTAMKIFKEKGEFLEEGAGAFLTRMAELFPFLKENKPVAIGLEDFQFFFQTHVRKATLLRHIFMNFIGNTWKDHIPLLKRREFLINHEIVGDILQKTNKTPDRVEDIVVRIGRGRTWRTMQLFLKPMFEELGISKTKNIWYSALDLGTANNPATRKRDVDKFLRRLQEQRDHAASV